MNPAYEHLKNLSKNISHLQGVSSILEWDQETHMPEDGVKARSDQLSLLSGMIHREKTGKAFSEALDALIDLRSGKFRTKQLTEREKKALVLWRSDYLKAVVLPIDFIEKYKKLSSQSIQAWRFAKQNNSFQHFAPFLEKIVEMSRQKAEYLGYQDHPYDALLDCFEPELTTEQVSSLFQTLKKQIKLLLEKITKSKQLEDSFLFGKFSKGRQIDFALKLLESVGYDTKKGRLDLSFHPFSSASHPTDSRITTYIHPSSIKSCILSTLHEAGHGLYEMGLPVEEFGTPLGESLSLGIHESQSKWWETFIGQSRPFWSYFFPFLKKVFKNKFDMISVNSFYKAINKVEPSFIRTEADEVTYPLHVILRFELEKALIEGSLNVKDIPEAWNEKMQTLLGIVPSTLKEGCLQDIHWSMGEFGYFPSYTLGNIYAAQLFSEFENQFPKWDNRVSKGEFLFIKQWLNENVHCFGRQFSSKELLKKVTHRVVSSQSYVEYLNDKYQKIYRA